MNNVRDGTKGACLSNCQIISDGKSSRRIFAITKDEDYLQSLDNQAKVRNLEKHIDQVVCKLYDLTSEEIAIVEGKEQ
ncbi:MAG: hypothetical protein HW406_1012, partial [Candidatus Brocadiaceae bacterium]|nr:hypothetical protein [Candidatus Brocadiaceae bacterium]